MIGTVKNGCRRTVRDTVYFNTHSLSVPETDIPHECILLVDNNQFISGFIYVSTIRHYPHYRLNVHQEHSRRVPPDWNRFPSGLYLTPLLVTQSGKT